MLLKLSSTYSIEILDWFLLLLKIPRYFLRNMKTFRIRQTTMTKIWYFKSKSNNALLAFKYNLVMVTKSRQRLQRVTKAMLASCTRNKRVFPELDRIQNLQKNEWKPEKNADKSRKMYKFVQKWSVPVPIAALTRTES